MTETLELSTSDRIIFKRTVRPDGRVVKFYRCVVPAGIVIRDNEHGKGLFATKDFKAGECLSVNRYEVVEDNDDEYCLITQYGEFPLINKNHTHFIKTEDKKKLSTFDTFMNHACDSNVNFLECEDLKYKMIAARPIKANEELTCNYSSFSYEFFEDVIDGCLCASANCQKVIRGFKHLPLPEQIKMLPHAESAVKAYFIRDYPHLRADHLLWGCTPEQIAVADKLAGHTIVLDYNIDLAAKLDAGYSTEERTIVFMAVDKKRQALQQLMKRIVPEGIEIKPGPYGLGLYAKKKFAKGSVIYRSRLETIHEAAAKVSYTLQTNQGDYLIDKTHSVRISDNERHLFTFDSFMNHSCDPTYIDKIDPLDANRYSAIALKDIQPGDEINCNYNLFDFDCDGHAIEVCQCGAVNCKRKRVGFKYLSPEEQNEISHLVNVPMPQL